MQNVMTLLASFVDKKKVTAAEAGSLVGAALKVGEINVGVMAMLDAGHNARFGAPSPHSVRTTPVKGTRFVYIVCVCANAISMTQFSLFTQARQF